ncbi:MAG: hypothetical protein EB084_01825 [Proteobacteria bacterium]|nr:hypothetical protein [Pseudomonadota bacterium]
MPLMFIERLDGPIDEAAWREAVEHVGGVLLDESLDVALRDEGGAWTRALIWNASSAEFSVMRYCAPFREGIEAIARALSAVVVDNDGARYL